ncbi:hypothetical protein JX266_007721 [Neoarthrinium moseri]|nr:hypothetical protein JX266_007721 [Neoarthrinium moseri]
MDVRVQSFSFEWFQVSISCVSEYLSGRRGMADLSILQAATTRARSQEAIELEESGHDGRLRQNQSRTVPPIYEAPNGGYAWICALSVFLINAHTWGVNSVGALPLPGLGSIWNSNCIIQSWAVILAYYSANEIFPSATHLEYSLIGGLSISQALMVSPIVTKCYHHYGLRTNLLIGTALEFVALFTTSYATQIWHLFLSQGVCFGWGMGFLYITASAALPPWFSTRRSLAVGLSTAGAGIGGVIYSLATNSAIQNVGIEWAYRILALCTLLANFASVLTLREVNYGVPHRTREDHSLRLRDFTRIEVILVVFWGTVTELGYITLLYSLPSYATSVGLTPTQGSIANALLNLGLGIGRPLVGYFSDRVGRINMAMSMTALCGVWCFALWIPAKGFALLSVFALLAGGICGTFWATVTPVLVEVVGVSKLARIFGVICICMVLPTTFAEPVAMQIVNTQKSTASIFLAAQIFVGCTFIAGALSLVFLRAWKIANLESEAASGTSDLSRSISRLTGTEVRHNLSWLRPKTLLKLKRV